ncbi:uncharacterized protein LOC115783277 isoform X2 [Archocentrus centrarchus]|nr:uncharacterized protein LOC115783277 isoform X2 [Archocentrus centrarchus]XP_030589891.1 uncharacterized protein LOC115783277 isoform X2 [Archocentrus centrarchus]XP_030589892.1 uncharacterized protein LOC115783277 isoform X2 [Archocentrus centrarchus]
MDVLNSLEIFIPEEAEVKNIPLWSLPNSVLRRMGLPLINASRSLADSPEGIWICPVMVRKKGQRPNLHTGSAIDNMTSALGTELRAARGPFRMSFVSSNRAAYEVLKGTTPRAPTCQTSLFPQDSAPQTNKDAVVIYRGQVYLSIRMPGRSHGQRGPQTISQSATPSTSHLSSKKQKKETVNDNRPKKKINICKGMYRENKKDDMHRRKDVHPKPIESEQEVGSQHPQDSRGEQLSDASPKTTCFQPPVEQEKVSDSGEYEMQELGADESQGPHENNDTDNNRQMDIREVDQSSSGRMEHLSAAAASTSLQMNCDFNELAEEERIAQMRAKLRQNEAALNLLS